MEIFKDLSFPDLKTLIISDLAKEKLKFANLFVNLDHLSAVSNTNNLSRAEFLYVNPDQETRLKLAWRTNLKFNNLYSSIQGSTVMKK